MDTRILVLASLAFPIAAGAQNTVDAAQIAASDAKIESAIGFIDRTWASTDRYPTASRFSRC